jgi:hypothetical protein
MSSFLLSSMICIAAIVFAALVGLALILLRPARGTANQIKQVASAGTARRPRRSWQSWLPYFGIALLLAIWTILAALFFLAVVWLMRQSPGPGTEFKVGENEKRTARRVYTWLFWSSLLTVPMFMIALFTADNTSTSGRVLAALIPLILHVPLLAGLTSKNGFVYRHTQQGILLISIRAAVASIAVSLGQYTGDGLLLFLFGNGGLWLFGSIWGREQVNRGECWLMQRRGESIQTAVGSGVADLTPQVHLEKSREFIQQFKKEAAKAHALAAFRKGNRDDRLQALWALDVLEEVEKF